MPLSRRADVLSVILRGCLLLLAAASAGADTLETVGVALLRSFDPTLNGSSVSVAVAEASLPAPGGWQINPSAVAQPELLFTWRSADGSATNFPNSLSAESWHANSVASWFFGPAPYGVARGVFQVDNFDAEYFGGDIVPGQTAIAAQIVNQSFTYVAESPAVDQDYDNYAARFNVLFVTGAGNEGTVKSPGTAYNGLAVAAQGGQSSVGPTVQGRSKPDITVPSTHTSFSTPVVSGSAALLLQAIQRGDGGGSNTAAIATDTRLLRALLLNGAQKPAGWTNASAAGMDFRHGAGVLNVFASWRQLRGGRFLPGASDQVPNGQPHPPLAFTNGITARRGWDVSSISSSMTQDGIRNYFFDVQGASNRAFSLTATLAWNRQRNQTLINNLDLFLYTTNAVLLAARQSTVDNLEHLWVPNLPPGKYTLQVWKAGGVVGRVTNEETYALAFDFGPSEPAQFGPATLAFGQLHVPLMGEPNTSYRIQGTTDFLTWSTVSTNFTPASGLSDIAVGATPGMKFFRALELP